MLVSIYGLSIRMCSPSNKAALFLTKLFTFYVFDSSNLHNSIMIESVNENMFGYFFAPHLNSLTQWMREANNGEIFFEAVIKVSSTDFETNDVTIVQEMFKCR